MLQAQPFDIHALHAAYARGVSAGQVVDEAFRRIGALDDTGIFLALRERQEVEADIAALGSFDPVAKPLWGVPFAIKDNIDAAGMATTAACPDFAYVADEDAFVVGLLRQAGALLIGKTNLDQFATGLVGVRTPYPVPRNALDPTIVPGGSSSGSAVAVARGLVSFALGTDTAGSGRVPAALNGIVGLKPSLGALSNSGVVPACRTLDTMSVFALTSEDAYGVFRIAARFDAADPFARPMPAPPFAAILPAFSIGVPNPTSRRFFGDDRQAASFEHTLARIASLGARIVELDFQPFFDVASLLYDGAWIAERYAAIEDLLQRKPDALLPVTRQIIDKARVFSAADAFRDIYRLRELARSAEFLLQSVDGLCVPTIPGFVTLAEVESDPIGPNTRLGTYTNFVNLLDLCAIAVPVAPRSDGRPGGVTLLARAGLDAQIAALGASLHRDGGGLMGVTGWSLPPVHSDAVETEPSEIAIAAVGAHMSGLPLNGELTRLGARFLEASRTTSDYRLYSLPGGPPRRPGLVRVATGGAAIALEVWALPLTRFGEFMRGIPQPLGIGTVTLEDGRAVKGFICEPIAIDGARDITEFGGWRAYLAVRAQPVEH